MTTVLHSALTTTDLHEPKGIAAQAADKVYVSDGAGSGAWTAVDHPVFVNKHIAGLTWANAADASNDFTVAAGTCRDSTNTEDMTLSSAITKQIDAAWAVGNNQGGFDTGSVLTTGVYHLFLIKRTDTDVVDVIYSATPSGPTLPTNYTKSRRIGSFFRQSSVNVAITVTEIEGGGIECWRTTPVESSSTGSLSGTGTNVSLAQFPNNTSGLEAIFSWSASLQNNNFYFTPTTTTGLNLATLTNSTIGTVLDNGGGTVLGRLGGFVRCPASLGQVRGYSASSSGAAILTTLGWKDPRS